MVETIAVSTYLLLNDEQKKRIDDFWQDNKSKRHPDAQSLQLVRAPNPLILNFSIQPLLKTNPALFAYTDGPTKEALKQALRLAYYQLATAYRADEILSKEYRLKSYQRDMARCAYLLQWLEDPNTPHSTKTAANNQNVPNMLLATATDFSTGQTIYYRDWMANIKTWLSFLGWAINTIRIAASLFPYDYYNIQRTIEVTTNPQEGLQFFACILHYSRFLMNFLLVCKHAIKNPLMSPDEAALVDVTGGVGGNFIRQLAAEKFMLLNDLVKGTNSFLAILLFMKPAFGQIGDIVTGCIIAGDLILNEWAKSEAEKKHREDIKFYDDEIAAMKDIYYNQLKRNSEIDGFLRSKHQFTTNALEEEGKRLKQSMIDVAYELNLLENAKQACEAEWLKNQRNYLIDRYYIAASLFIYPFIALPWAQFGIAASAEAILLASTAAGFFLTIAYTCYKTYVSVTESLGEQKTALTNCIEILSRNEISEADYIRFQDLRLQADYQAALSQHQFYIFIRSIVVQAIIPIALFAGFTFSTFGIGVAAFAIVAVIAIISHYAIAYFEPAEAAMSKFDEAGYTEFVNNRVKISQQVEKEVSHIKSDGVLSLFKTYTPEVSDSKDDVKNQHDTGLAGA